MEENMEESIIRAAIHQALQDVKMGNAFMVEGLQETDFELLQSGDEEKLTKLFSMVAKRLGATVSPKKKKRGMKTVLQTLKNQRQMWIQEIQEYDETKQTVDVRVMGEEHVTAPPSHSSEDVAVKIDADAVEEEIQKEAPSPATKPKATPISNSALVTCDSKSEDGMVKSESATDEMNVVKLKEKTEGNENPKQLNLESAKMDTEETINDGDSKPKPTDTATGTSGDQTRVDGMDVEESIEAGTENTTGNSKKRKSDAMDDTKRKKSKGIKTRTAVEKKRKATKKRRKKTAFTDEQIEATREKLKKEFEEEKAEILAELPKEYKNLWGQCGFAKWGKAWLPCLFVSPFDVGGSQMRDDWMKMYNGTRDRRDQMSYLVYWYGQENMSNAYSFCAKAQIMTYEDGVKKKHDKLPPNVQKKVDAGRKLTKAEKELVKGYEEMEADLLRLPEVRTAFEGFHEDYENDVFIRTLMTGEDSGEELISSDEESLSSASSSSELDSGSDDDEVQQRPKAKKAKKPAAKKPKTLAEPPIAPTVEEEMDFAEDEVSSDEDLKDEDVVLSEETSESEEERDADYIVNEPGLKGKKNKSSEKKEQKKKGGGKPPKEKKPKEGPKSNSVLARNRKEHKLFRQNQEMFIPILEKWKSYIMDEDASSIEGVLQEMLTLVDQMGAPFMVAYNVSPLMKDTKDLLRQKNVDMASHKKLKKMLWKSYDEKKKLVPEGFVSKMEKQVKKKIKRDESDSATKDDRKPKAKISKAKQEKRKSVESSSLDRIESTNSLPGSLAQSSATHGTPVQRVYSQGSTSPKPSIASPIRKVQAKKPEKASFSLSNMINKKPSASRSSEVDVNRNSQSSQTSATKSLPLWLTSAPTDDVASLPAEQVDRLLALEFLQSMASYFPEEKVNRESVARSLEAAIYQWSMGQYRKEEAYWPKVHAIVAAVCGKTKSGTLLDAIVAGEYESAMDVVTLSDDLLLHSFECS